MSGETPRKIGRGYARDLNVGSFQPMIGSFDLHLRAEHKSPKTITIYTDAATWFASAYLVPAGLTDWSQVTARHVQEWVSTLLAGYTDQYANNQFRALQQFFKWHATEDPDEPSIRSQLPDHWRRPPPAVGRVVLDGAPVDFPALTVALGCRDFGERHVQAIPGGAVARVFENGRQVTRRFPAAARRRPTPPASR